MCVSSKKCGFGVVINRKTENFVGFYVGYRSSKSLYKYGLKIDDKFS